MVKGMMMAIAVASLSSTDPGAGKAVSRLITHIAEIEVDPAQLDAYKVYLAEEQEASVRLEPGVLMLNSVALADDPSHIRLLEVYANAAAYEAHLKALHFLKYKTATALMVRSLKLIETKPIRLCAKSSGAGGAAKCV